MEIQIGAAINSHVRKNCFLPAAIFVGYLELETGTVMADFTPTQGRYLAYIHAYTNLHGIPPAEIDIARAMCVSPPSVNQMVKALEKRGLLERQPGMPRSLRVLIPEDEIQSWNNRKAAANPPASGSPSKKRSASPPAAPPANLYVFAIFLTSGPLSEKFANKECSRVIEIRGDQTLHQFHQAIFAAYDRTGEHRYQFQLGKRPFDPNGPNYGIPDPESGEKADKDARTSNVDDLGLDPHRAFGYVFDFGDEWFHQVQVEKIEKAIPTVTYPRVIRRVGKSPPIGDGSVR